MATKTSSSRILEFSTQMTVAVDMNLGQIHQLDLGYSSRDKVGIRIRQIEYFIPAAQPDSGTIWDAVGTSSQLTFGLQINTKAPTSYPQATDPGIIDWNQCRAYLKTLTAVGVVHVPEIQPFIKKDLVPIFDLGKLVHPSSLFLFAWKSSAVLDAAVKLAIKIAYTTEDLSPDDYDELITQVLLTRS